MKPVLELTELSMPWIGLDPFIMTVHHVDHYPAGNEWQGPVADLDGRRLSADFSYRDGWSMYHGIKVPGFPQHPHRGFETVTVVRRGYVDHSDSLGATARYGEGDTQWLTTGSGIQHSEMFPLVDGEGSNDLELFQIWLNLPPQLEDGPSPLLDALGRRDTDGGRRGRPGDGGRHRRGPRRAPRSSPAARLVGDTLHI